MADKKFSIEAVFRAIDKISSPVRGIQRRMKRVTSSMVKGLKAVNRVSDKLIRGFGKMARAAGRLAIIGIGAVVGAIGLLVREFSKIEDAEAAFTPLLGGAAKAKKLVEELNKTAATTPFQFETLADTANQLLPIMNGNIEDTIKITRMLGDTAGGNAQKLERITRGYTKAMLKGKVDMESLNMVAEAGVPIFQELADSMGVALGPKFFKMLRGGKIGTDDLTDAFKKMTSEGGIFFGGMEIASKTTSGMISTLKDNLSLTAAAIGEVLAPTIKDLILEATGAAQSMKEWVSNNQELIRGKFVDFVKAAREGIGALVARVKELNSQHDLLGKLKEIFIGIGRAISFLVAHGEAIMKIIAVIAALIIILKVFNAVMIVVNAVMLANPVVLIILAIAALILIIIAMIVYWDEVKVVLGLLGDFFIELWGSIVAYFKGVWKAIVDTVMQGVEWVKKIFFKIKSFLQPVIDFLVAAWEVYFGIVKAILEFLVGLWALYIGLLKAIFTPILDFFIAAWSWIVDAAVVAFEFLVNAMTAWFEIIDHVVRTVFNFLAGMWGTIATAAGVAFDWIVEKVKTVYEGIKTIFGTIVDFFAGIWQGVLDVVTPIIDKIRALIDPIIQGIKFVRSIGAGILGTGETGEGDQSGAGPNVVPMVSPQERTAKSIEESRSTSSSEVTIKDETGRAEVTKGQLSEGVSMQRTGTF